MSVLAYYMRFSAYCVSVLAHYMGFNAYCAPVLAHYISYIAYYASVLAHYMTAFAYYFSVFDFNMYFNASYSKNMQRDCFAWMFVLGSISMVGDASSSLAKICIAEPRLIQNS